MMLVLHKERRFFEIALIVVTLGMTCLLFQLGDFKMLALNLFFLPIVLSGYYLGRTSAGVLAIFCALAVTVAATLDNTPLAVFDSPLKMGIALTVWAAVLGMTALLVGTLCDERASTVNELQAAYVGVVEVLHKYLQSGNPRFKARSTRVAELCQLVAEVMKLPRKEIDDIRVGALLYDLGRVEITTELISRAVDSLEAIPPKSYKHTFLGTDLVHSLGVVLHNAVPLLVCQNDDLRECLPSEDDMEPRHKPQGAEIIRAVRAYDGLVHKQNRESGMAVADALKELRGDTLSSYDHEVLDALDVVTRAQSEEPALASV